MRAIIVNATALDQSGALAILKQFVAAIPQNDIKWIIFISEKVVITTQQHNINLEPIPGVKSLYKRFLWDSFGVKKWLKKNNIIPIASVSLQNTNFRTGYKIHNYIYYHQSIPFFDKKWSPFKANERTLWFYKNIYPFFVAVFLNQRTEIFVQLEYIKNGFVKRFKIDEDRVHVISPSFILPNKDIVEKIDLPLKTINLFYPATNHFYKNHKVLYDALNYDSNCTYALYTTLPESMGLITFDKVLQMYKSSDALVFPSYIETFGLPLIEAASFGLPIIAADLPYAREVLDGYEGVVYVKYDDPYMWRNALSMLKKKETYKAFAPKNRATWKDLFDLILKEIYNV